LLSASLRRDGLSVWAPGKKYANFPAASIGWRVSQENFLKNSKSISELKLRAGYGVTGIDGTALGNAYAWSIPVRRNQATYPFGNALDNGNSSFTNGLTNPELVWEKTDQINVGMDLGLLNNKVTLTAEFFNRKTDNIALNVQTVPSLGFGGAGELKNIGSMRNNGVEFQLGYHKREGEFRWEVTGLVSAIKNKVLKLYTAGASITAGGDQDFGGGDPITNTVVGRPIQSFYGYVVEGIFQDAAEVANSPVQVAGKTAPGDLKFKDLNGDKVINSADRTFIGSFLPDFTYSLNFSSNYKNFDMSFFFQGVQGNEIFNAERIILEGMPRLFNAGTRVLDSWTPTNTNTSMPRAISGDPNQNVRPSTRWIEDGSFLRMKNLMIGYTVPSSVFQRFSKNTFNRMRIYVSSQNLFTLTKYKGWDPEIGSKNGPITNGVDYGQYPTARSFQVGIQAGF
jgi:TonB-dependent starch-binding outer membrane protein SusC